MDASQNSYTLSASNGLCRLARAIDRPSALFRGLDFARTMNEALQDAQGMADLMGVEVTVIDRQTREHRTVKPKH